MTSRPKPRWKNLRRNNKRRRVRTKVREKHSQRVHDQEPDPVVSMPPMIIRYREREHEDGHEDKAH